MLNVEARRNCCESMTRIVDQNYTVLSTGEHIYKLYTTVSEFRAQNSQGTS
jgi:hypothetical protein